MLTPLLFAATFLAAQPPVAAATTSAEEGQPTTRAPIAVPAPDVPDREPRIDPATLTCDGGPHSLSIVRGGAAGCGFGAIVPTVLALAGGAVSLYLVYVMTTLPPESGDVYVPAILIPFIGILMVAQLTATVVVPMYGLLTAGAALFGATLGAVASGRSPRWPVLGGLAGFAMAACVAPTVLLGPCAAAWALNVYAPNDRPVPGDLIWSLPAALGLGFAACAGPLATFGAVAADSAWGEPMAKPPEDADFRRYDRGRYDREQAY